MGEVRIYGDVSTDHATDFMLIKAVHRCKTNSEGMEKLIELAIPDARRLAAKKKKA